jgi:hypothetical protein
MSLQPEGIGGRGLINGVVRQPTSMAAASGPERWVDDTRFVTITASSAAKLRLPIWNFSQMNTKRNSFPKATGCT